jgi:hypothetical protein
MFITFSVAVAGFCVNDFLDVGGRHEFHGFQCTTFGNTVFDAFAGLRGDYARGFFVFARTAVPILVRTQPNIGLGATIFTQTAVLSIVGVTGTSRLGTMGCHQQRIPVIISLVAVLISLVAVTFLVPARSSLTSELLVGGSESCTGRASGSSCGGRLEAGQGLVVRVVIRDA